MGLFRRDLNINFLGKRRIAFVISGTLIVVGIIALIVNGGPNYGIDFSGGTLFQFRFEKPVDIGAVRKVVGSLNLGNTEIQRFGEPNEILVRVQETSEELEDLGQKVGSVLDEAFPDQKVELRRTEMVGPKVGKDLRKKAVLSIIYALVGILIYIAVRFQIKFSVAAVAAIFHDVVITVGIFTLANKEFNLPVVGALLTIVGYSLNDTIVVFDRVRENLKLRRRDDYETLLNVSINQTLSRTILTSFTTLVVVITLFVLGGGVIHDFAFTLIVGIVVGTYSTVYIASPLVMYWENYARSRMRPGAAARRR